MQPQHHNIIYFKLLDDSRFRQKRALVVDAFMNYVDDKVLIEKELNPKHPNFHTMLQEQQQQLIKEKQEEAIKNIEASNEKITEAVQVIKQEQRDKVIVQTLTNAFLSSPQTNIQQPQVKELTVYDKKLIEFFVDAIPCFFEGCEQLRFSYKKEIEAMGGDGCPACKQGAVKRKYLAQIKEKYYTEAQYKEQYT